MRRPDPTEARLEHQKIKRAEMEYGQDAVYRILSAQLNLANDLNDSDNLEQGLSLCLEAAIATSEMDSGGIYLFDDDAAEFKLIVHQGLSREFVDHVSVYSVDSENIKLVMKGAHFYENCRQWAGPMGQIARDDNLQAIAVVPIRHKNKTIGCINVGSHTQAGIPEISRISLELIAMRIGSAISRLMSEKALQESEERYRIAIKHSIDGIALSEAGRYFFVNPAYLKIFGYERPEEITGKKITVTVHPDDKKRVWRIYNLRLHGKKVPEMYEFKGIRKDGTSNYIEITATNIKYNGRSLILAYFRDITEKKKAVEGIKESELKFRSLFEDSPQAIALTSFTTGEVIDVNHKFCELTGYTKDEIIGRNTVDMGFYNNEGRNNFLGRLKKYGKLEEWEFDFKIKDQTVLNTLVSAKIIDICGAPFILAIFVDMTDFKRLESRLRQAQKMESVGTLAGGIAHDFNNILGIILGNAEMAKIMINRGNPVELNIDQIIEASLRARQVIRQLLDFSRQTPQTKLSLALSPLIKESITLLRPLIPANIDIRESYKDDTSKALVDPTQVHQIIINLFTNASHAMSEKGGVIDLTHDTMVITGKNRGLYGRLTPGRYIRLKIRDTGDGIAPEHLNRIFDPYFTTKGFAAGTGLGLSVVQGIVDDLKGAIAVSSHPREGTTFTLLFPEAGAQVEKKIFCKNRGLSRGSERVLLIDDECSLGSIAGDMLKNLGYRAIHVQSSAEALKMIVSDPHRFDLVITDTAMPEMTGPDLADKILRIRPDMPMILCTGHHANIDEAKAMQMGFKAFLIKPVKMAVLAQAVRKTMDDGQITADERTTNQ